MSEWIPWIAWINAMIDTAVGVAVILLACFQRPRLSGGWLFLTGSAAVGLSWLSMLFKAILVGKVVDTPLPVIYLALVWIGITPLMLGAFTWLLYRHAATIVGRRLVIGFVTLSGLTSCIVLYASLIEPYWLEVREVELPLANVPPDMPPMRVAVLADIQTDVYGPYEKQWLRTLNDLQPDMILLPGDFFDCESYELARKRDQFIELLRQLDAPYGVYACQGNIDGLRELGRMMADTNITLLADEAQVVTWHGARIAIGGVVYDLFNTSDPPFMHRMQAVDADAHLLMSHVPDAALGAIPEDNIDLLICGHTHGGQVQIPGLGPLYVNSEVPLSVGAGGLHTFGTQRLYISRGVGHERRGAPPLRFWCRPELTILKLVSDGTRTERLVETGD